MAARVWKKSEEQKKEELTALESASYERSPRHTVNCGMSEAEFEMINRLSKSLGMSKAGVLRVGLHGLYYSHFQRRGDST